MPERRPLEDAVFSQHDPLAADRLPVTFVDALLEHDRRLGVAQAAGLDHDGQRHRVADEDHRADLDLGQPDVPRALVGPGGDGEDRDVLPDGRLDGAKGIFAGVGPAVGRHDHAGDRLAAMGRQHAVERVAQRRDRPVRLDVVELARPRRLARARLGRRLQVVDEQLPAACRAPRGSAAATVLDQVQPRRLAQPLDRRLARPRTRASSSAASSAARELSVYGSENFMLSESSSDDRQVRRDRLAAGRDQHRLEQHGRRRPASVSTAQADQERPLQLRQVAALPAGRASRASTDRQERRQDQHDGRRSLRQRRELEPRIAPGDDAGRRGSIPRSICQIRFMVFDSIRATSA